MPITRLTPDQRRQFEDQGFIILPQFLEMQVVRGVILEMERLVDKWAEEQVTAGKLSDSLKDEAFEFRLAKLRAACPDVPIRLFRKELHLPGLFPILFHPELLDWVEDILGGEIRLYPNYSARPKLPNDPPTLVLWHQDGGYTKGEVEQLRMVNAWTPLVPARVENGCMQFIPGTHKLGLVPHESQEHYLAIRPDFIEPRMKDAVNIELAPTDIVLFHNMLFHRGLPNRSRMVRWSMDWRYQDATQSTMRQTEGHIARSRSRPKSAVKSAEEWAGLKFR